MDETTYSQILHFYSSSDRKYPEYIYDVIYDIILHINLFLKINFCKQWLTYPASFTLNDQTSTAIYLENTGVHFNPVTAVV